MKRIICFSIAIGLALVTLTVYAISAAPIPETEPNNTPAEANMIDPFSTYSGAINPTGDLDYFALDGVNTTWGFIALMDTSGSATSKEGLLQALGGDGTTVLQQDQGSWEKGSGIALQNFANGSDIHYLRASQAGNDDTISAYTIRYYETVITAQKEIEPNETRLTGTPSSFTMSGAITHTGDVDCFAFQGRATDIVLLALNGDPEGDGSPVNLALSLVGPSNQVLKQVNVSGVGGKEFIEYVNLPGAGIYAYCVSAAAGTPGPAAIYKAGIVRNGGLYYPSYIQGPQWQNKPPVKFAQIGDFLDFRLAITNTSPLAIPGAIDLDASFDADCLQLAGIRPDPTHFSPGEITWEGQKYGLASGEVYSVTVSMLALKSCESDFYQGTGVDYYFTGHGNSIPYKISKPVYLPMLRR